MSLNTVFSIIINFISKHSGELGVFLATVPLLIAWYSWNQKHNVAIPFVKLKLPIPFAVASIPFEKCCSCKPTGDGYKLSFNFKGFTDTLEEIPAFISLCYKFENATSLVFKRAITFNYCSRNNKPIILELHCSSLQCFKVNYTIKQGKNIINLSRCNIPKTVLKNVTEICFVLDNSTDIYTKTNPSGEFTIKKLCIK